MRGWRNWQTRTFEVRVGNLEGSNPFPRTRKRPFSESWKSAFFFAAAQTGTQKAQARGGLRCLLLF